MTSDLFWRIFPMWLEAFGLTLLMEAPIYILLGRWYTRTAPERPSVLSLAAAGAIATCITHPMLWFLWPQVVSDYAWYVASGEILVTLVETAVFFGLIRPLRLKHALIASIAANGFSCGMGYLVHVLKG